MHIASRAKVASRSRHDHRLDIGGVYQPSKQVTDFGIRTERQGILALRPVQGQCGKLAIGGHRPQKVPGLVIGIRTLVVSHGVNDRSEEHTSELQSLVRISYAVFCLKKKKYK